MILQNICLKRYWLQLHNLSIMRSSQPPFRTNPMIKSELVTKITDTYPGLYQRDADLIVNTIFNEISEALARGDRVEIRGFGSFNTKETQARVARNPKSGQKIPVQEKIKPVFRAGKELKLRINQE